MRILAVGVDKTVIAHWVGYRRHRDYVDVDVAIKVDMSQRILDRSRLGGRAVMTLDGIPLPPDE